MSEAKHTPGPWALWPNGDEHDGWWIGPDGENVCRVYGYRDHPGNLANATLLAAATDMLAALKAALPVLEAAQRIFAKDAAAMGLVPGGAVDAAVRSAIAKAEPRSNKEEAA